MNDTIEKIMCSLVGVKAPQRKFLLILFTVIMCRVGRANFRNMSRFSQVSEKTFSRWYRRPFDFVTQPSCEQTTQVVTPQLSVPEHNLECSQATECAPRQQSEAETISGKGFQTPKISKTYIDFKEAIKNFKQPIHDLEAWLASKTKAGQNRWSVYYQKYQGENKAYKSGSD